MRTTPVSAPRPRAMVLDEVWRGLDGVEPLSGPHGGPLSRTVKLVLDPLVIRPVQNPQCAGPMLSPDGAVHLSTLLNAAADRLRATAAWFALLKQSRRAARITDGNPQDLYFQRCFELASVHGMPDPVQGRPIADEALRDVHDAAAGRTVAALKEHVVDPARARELWRLIDIAWRRRPIHVALEDNSDLIRELLDECTSASDDDSLRDLLDAHAGTHSGIALWRDGAQRLGLTVHAQPIAPALGASASTADLGLPFDRTVYERVFMTLQASTDRADLPPIPELVTTEIARSCAPWALLDESLRVAAATGIELAVGLRPTGGDSPTEAHRVINRRWQREAYVLRARRLFLDTDTDSPPSKLADIAAELHEPWRAYLRRLWVRLHGRDVRGSSVYDVGELWDLLDGVARSVILDHRDRVKQALRIALTPVTGSPSQSRAS